jgi:hypothetical protein
MKHTLAAALLGLTLAPACHAGYTASTTVDTAAGSVINLAPFVQVVDDPLQRKTTQSTPSALTDAQSATADYRSSLYNLSGSASAMAQASPGALRLQAAAQGATNITPPAGGTTRAFLSSGGYAYAEARTVDTMVWTHSSGATGLVYLDLVVRFDGTADVSKNNVGGWSDGYAEYQWGFNMPWGGGASGVKAYSWDSSDVVRNSTSFGNFVVTVPVWLGVPVDLTMWANATTRANGYSQCDNCNFVVNGAAAALGDYSHTFAWQGVQAARWADGSAIDVAAVSGKGASGFDYATAVPEATTTAYFLRGLVVFGLLRRRSSTATA